MRMVPVIFTWRNVEVTDADGVATKTRAMVPLARFGNIVAQQFHEGEEYPLVVLEARSRGSHNQYFAALADGFTNLPENLPAVAERLGLKTIPPKGWINVEHLRKWCLCETGWCDVGEFNFETEAEAKRLARFYRSRDNYCQIQVIGKHVTIREAKSQSAAAMSKEPFEKSKRDVLDLVESIIDVESGTLNKQAGRSA